MPQTVNNFDTVSVLMQYSTLSVLYLFEKQERKRQEFKSLFELAHFGRK